MCITIAACWGRSVVNIEKGYVDNEKGDQLKGAAAPGQVYLSTVCAEPQCCCHIRSIGSVCEIDLRVINAGHEFIMRLRFGRGAKIQNFIFQEPHRPNPCASPPTRIRQETESS